MKHTRGSDHSYKRPVEAWTEATVRVISSTVLLRLTNPIRDCLTVNVMVGFLNQRACRAQTNITIPFLLRRFPVSPTKGSPGVAIRPVEVLDHDHILQQIQQVFHHMTGLKTTPSNQSGIPRRTSGSRASHGRSSSLGKSSDFTSQLPVSAEYKVDQGVYTSPSQRP
ncbi:hypothetical protein BSL78_15047 [Apostichopus japonicus]|uniref:Uncharacterized protein n=1 Tax=Stichopus japonicus TaxID=307972 RepID=A0A2G8KJC7_STIJA|nr:hypothetical protein BSL78_15047 [Apostichopus japonicus]